MDFPHHRRNRVSVINCFFHLSKKFTVQELKLILQLSPTSTTISGSTKAELVNKVSQYMVVATAYSQAAQVHSL